MMEDSVNRLPRWELQSYHSRNISRLKKLLGMEGIFHFVPLEFNDPAYRDQVIQHVNALCRNLGILEVNAQTFPTYEDLEPILLATFKKHKALHLVGLDNWFTPPDGPSRIRGFNYHRETIAENCPGLLILWLTGEGIRKIALEAPDLWAWRSAVLDFTIPKESPADPIVERRIDTNSASYPSRIKRIQEIDDYLADKKEEIPKRQLAMLLLEKGKLLRGIGRLDEALAALWKAHAIQKETNNKRSVAVILGGIARIKTNQGMVEDALEMHQEELKVYEELGDKLSRAVTLGDIARIINDQGMIEDSLEMHREALKVYKELGNVSDKANALFNLGEIEQTRGNHQIAHDYLKESYALLDKIQHLEGISTVGLTWGELLCTTGKRQEGLAVLRRSLNGFRQLKKEDMAARAEVSIARFETDPKGSGEK